MSVQAREQAEAGNIIGETLADVARATRLSIPSILVMLAGDALGRALSRPADEWLVFGLLIVIAWYLLVAVWTMYAAARIRARSRSAGRAAALMVAWVLLHSLVLLGMGEGNILPFAGLLTVPALLGYGIASILVHRRTLSSTRGSIGNVPSVNSDLGEPVMDGDSDLRSQLRDEMMTRAANGFRGWTRADGSYADGDGRGDYQRALGPAWRTAYELDRRAAVAALIPRSSKDAPVDPVEQAREWARLALAEEGSRVELDPK